MKSPQVSVTSPLCRESMHPSVWSNQRFSITHGQQCRPFCILFAVGLNSQLKKEKNEHLNLIICYHYDVVSNNGAFSCLLNSLCRPSSQKLQNPPYWPIVRGIHQWLVNSPHKGPVKCKKLPFDNVIILVPSHLYLNQWWAIRMMPYYITRQQWVQWNVWIIYFLHIWK